jgi:MoxR-like ATPase
MWSEKMLKCKVKDVRKYLRIAYEQKKPIFLWGKPGIGKSSAVKDFAVEMEKELGEPFPCDDHVRLSMMDPVDIGGLPIVENGMMGRVYPAWLPREGKGILFLDEMNKGLPSTQNAAYQLVLDRMLGDAKMADGWMIVAAGNRSIDKVTVYDMDSALQNRFPMHIEVDAPTAKELMQYFEEKGKFNPHVFGFLEFKPTRVWHFDEQTTDPAWASPRSWEFCIDLLEATKDIKDKGERMSTMRDIAVASVGDVVGRELYGFIQLSEQVDVRSILEHPEKFQEIDRPDIRHSVISEVAAMYQQDQKIEKKVIDFVYACSKQPELVMLALTMFNRSNKNFIRKAMADARSDALAAHLEKFIAL